MRRELSFYDDLSALETYFGFPGGSLVNIPIYARVAAVDAILKVRDLENSNIFRPGLYYIALADLCDQTTFNANYGDAEGDLRVEWFQTAIIESLGEIDISNYAHYIKSIGDAALLLFSSFADVVAWSDQLTTNLEGLSQEYEIYSSESHDNGTKLERRISDFKLNARRLIHLGEVSYNKSSDPMCLSVSQIFKAEKSFSETELGCTQVVAQTIQPKLDGLKLSLRENVELRIPGIDYNTMTYYVEKS